MVLAGLNGILMAFGSAGANFKWDDPRQMNAGGLGCLGQVVIIVLRGINLALFIGPLLLPTAFHLPPCMFAWAPAAIAVVCLAYLGLRTLVNWPQVDASHDMRAEDYGRKVMAAAPARAILFAQGDQAVFTLWYFQYALHERPDVAIIANDLLPLDWYRENLQYTYPDLMVPPSSNLPWLAAVREANAGRAACYPYYEDLVLNCR